MRHKYVDEIEKRYIVTSDGRCINRKTGTAKVFMLDKKGYPRARLYMPPFSKNKDKRIGFRMHRLVAMIHLKDFTTNLEVNHKNGIKTDNRVENLEMVTSGYNAWHGWNVLNSAKRRKRLSKLRKGSKHTKEAIEKISRAKRLRDAERKKVEITKEKAIKL